MNLENQNIVFFDGSCGLCNEFVDFVFKIDKRKTFSFTPLQGDLATRLLPRSYTQNPSTIVIIIDGNLYTKSQAILSLFYKVGGFWKLFIIFSIFPDWLLNIFYNIIAKNRHFLIKKKENCRLPTPEERQRFIL